MERCGQTPIAFSRGQGVAGLEGEGGIGGCTAAAGLDSCWINVCVWLSVYMWPKNVQQRRLDVPLVQGTVRAGWPGGGCGERDLRCSSCSPHWQWLGLNCCSSSCWTSGPAGYLLPRIPCLVAVLALILLTLPDFSQPGLRREKTRHGKKWADTATPTAFQRARWPGRSGIMH